LALESTTFFADDMDVSVRLAAFLNQYCADCHGDGADEGDFELKFLRDYLAESAGFDAWQLVHDRIKTGVMPPQDAEQPTAEEVKTVLAPLADALAAAQKKAAGRVGSSHRAAIECDRV